MKTILVVSSAGQGTETAVLGNGELSFYMPYHFLDINTKERLDELDECIAKNKPSAILLDLFTISSGQPAFTPRALKLAAAWKQKEIETFFLMKEDEIFFENSLWRAHKPLRFRDMEKPICCVARIGTSGREVFHTDTGKVFVTTAGDRGDRQIEHAVRNWRAFWDRNWPRIFNLIEVELKSKE